MSYVFTWCGWAGPCVRRFRELDGLLAFAGGWPEPVQIVSLQQLRG